MPSADFLWNIARSYMVLLSPTNPSLVGNNNKFAYKIYLFLHLSKHKVMTFNIWILKLAISIRHYAMIILEYNEMIIT